MRSGFAGELLNSIVVNTGTALGFDVDSAATGCAGQQTDPDNLADCTAQVLASTFDDGAALGAPENAALACGNADFRTTATGSDNVVNSASFPKLVDEDATLDPTGNAAGKLVAGLKVAPINPKPNFGLTGIAGGVNTGPTVATYRGAFDRTKPGLWTDGWTTLGTAGLLSAP
jgi:hypothetical protein